MDSFLLNTSSHKGGQVLSSGSTSRGQLQGFAAEGSFRETLNHNGSPSGSTGTLPDSSDLTALLKSLKEAIGDKATGHSMTPTSPSETKSPEGDVDLGLAGSVSDNFSPEELVSLLSKLSLKEMKEAQGVSEMDLKSLENLVSQGSISIRQLEYVQKALSKQGVEVSVMDLQKALTLSGYSKSDTGNQQIYVKNENLNGLMKLPESLSPNKALSLGGITSNLTDGSVFKLDSGILSQKASSASEWFPITVNRQAGEWGKELISALGDRLRMQVGQGVKEATVRLDPPELGRVDFSVRMDGDRVNVQINSSNQQVRELLAQQIDRLRMDLSQDNGGASVNVNVGDGKNRQNEQQKGNVIANNSENVVSSSDNELKLKTADLTNNNKYGLNTKA